MIPSDAGTFTQERSRTSSRTPRLLVFCVLFAACSNPTDIDVTRIVTTSHLDSGQDDPRFDTLTASVNATIRFEAAVDTSRIFLPRFAGSGLRISLLLIHPDTASLKPFRDVYSVSANYLDLPATGLPLRADIPAEFFFRRTNARIALALVVLYADDNANGRYDDGERMFGVSEQQLFGFAEGTRLHALPPMQFMNVRSGPNVLVRSSQTAFPGFRSAPDYTSTIFILHVRGPYYPYNIPYPWPTRGKLTP